MTPKRGSLPNVEAARITPMRTKTSTYYPRVFSCHPSSGLLIHGNSWHNRSKGGFSVTVPGATSGT